MKKIKVLLVSGGRNHGFEPCADSIKNTLKESGKVTVTTATDAKPFSPAKLDKYDVCVMYTCALKMNKTQQKALLRFVEGGKGLVALHGATVCAKETPALADMIGGTFNGHSDIMEFPVELRDPSNPLLRRIEGFSLTDELYKVKLRKGSRVLLEAYWRGKMLPLAYTRQYGNGNVFYLALGHNPQALEVPEVRKILLRGIEWAEGRYPVQERDIRAAILGYGAEHGPYHAQQIEQTTGLHTVAVCDEDPARRDAAEADIPGVQTFADERQLLLRSDIDLAVILFPAHKRTEAALRCLKAKKHISLEQPICLSSKDARRIISSADKGLSLGIYKETETAGFDAIRRTVLSGDIGRVFRIEAFAGGFERPAGGPGDEKTRSGGILYTMGAPLIQGILELIPEKVVRVTSFCQKNLWHHVTGEDDVQTIIEFDSGAVADIHVSTTASQPRAPWRILGTKGGILSDSVNQILDVVTGEGQTYIPFTNGDSCAYYTRLAGHLLEGEPMESNASMAARVISIIETAEKASRKTGPEKVRK